MAEILKKSQAICKKYKLSPKKRHGQNFLHDDSVYEAIVDAAEINNDDVVLEVGPGLGFLTERIAGLAKKVLTVEIDNDLLPILEDRFLEAGHKNIELINQDILDLSIDYKFNKVVANLPYHISSIFLRRFISERGESPESMILMLQNEVVDRICSVAPNMSLLSASVQYYMNAEKLLFVPREAFWPSPRVDSAVVKLRKKSKQEKLKLDEKKFFRLLKHGFSNKRKMLKNNLAAAYQKSSSDIELILENSNLNKKCRAQDLSLTEWAKLLGTFD